MGKRALRIGICIWLGFFIIFGAEAEVNNSLNNSLTIRPAIFELAVEEGESMQRQIMIRNNYQQELEIQVEVRGFTSTSKFGGIRFLDETNEGQHSARSWFSIREEKLIIPPGNERRVDVTVNVPSGIEPGSYYAAVIFVPQVEQSFTTSGASLIPAVGSLFLFDVGKTQVAIENSLGIIDFQFKDLVLSPWFSFISKVESFFHNYPVLVLDQAPSSFWLELKNSSNFYLRPQGKLLALNIFRREINSWNFPPTTVLPGQSRVIDGKLEWTEKPLIPPLLGRYEVYLKVNTKIELKQTKIILWIMPGRFLLSTAVVFCLLLVFVVKYRERILKSFSVLIKGK